MVHFRLILVLMICTSVTGSITDLIPCDDQYDTARCEEMRGKGFCVNPNTKAVLQRNCAATCHTCYETKATDCVDLRDNCDDLREIGLCKYAQGSDFAEVIARECRKTCGICKASEHCKDQFTIAQCNKLYDMGKCHTMMYMMSRCCAHTCEYCNHNTEDEDGYAYSVLQGWSGWGDWSICDVVCGRGVRYRSRSCVGGVACMGQGSEAGECTVEDCPKEICRTEQVDYCPFFEELGYCERKGSKEFMEEYCPISCKTCKKLEDGTAEKGVTPLYKLCVGRVLDDVVSTTFNALEQFNTPSSFGDDATVSPRLPADAQDSLRKLSRQGRVLTIQDQLFNKIVAGVNKECGAVSGGTGGFIEAKLLESKVIQISRVNCSAWCEGVAVGEVYRTMNGTCNNCGNPLWGSSTSILRRFLDAQYEDNTQSLPRGWSQHLPSTPPTTPPVHPDKALPSARLISQMLLGSHEIPDSHLTLMHFQWGQFLDHDLVLVPTSPMSVAAGGDTDCGQVCTNTHPCFPIQLAETDPITNMTNGRRTCLPFTRSAGIRFNVEGSSQYSNQINEISAYLDGSNVYGSSNFLALLLKGQKGQLREGAPCPDLNEGPMLPPCPNATNSHFCACGLESCPEKYIAGDARVNEQPMLVLMHTMWMREHNRIAGELGRLNTCWDSGKVFQETRKIVVGMMQHITYKLYLPVLLGPSGFMDYIGFTSRYNSHIQAGILNAFGTAAFRFGHSQIPSGVPLVDASWTKVDEEELHATFFRANMVCGCGFDNILRGLLTTPTSKVDKHFTTSVTDRLFAPHPHDMGLDLTSINTQRGRDHGLPPYTKYRDYCETKYKVKARFRDPEQTIKRIKEVYKDLDKVDLFIGGMLEEPVNTGLLGPTFSCIIGEQFKNLREADRFFYTHEGVFTKEQKLELFKTSLSRVMCDNSVTVDKVPRRAFLVQKPDDFVKCSALPKINLEKWRQCPEQ